MARPFRNYSSPNKAFGVFLESMNAGDYIHRKKLKTTYMLSDFGKEKNQIFINNIIIHYMANPFRNYSSSNKALCGASSANQAFGGSSSANKAFGVFLGSRDAGDYIHRKKLKTAYKILNYPYQNAINNANLNINLISKLDLTNVPVIQNFATGDVPTTITNSSVPFMDYNIDPSGNLFGDNICGINNWEKYLVYECLE